MGTTNTNPAAIAPTTPEVAALASELWAMEPTRLEAFLLSLAAHTPESVAAARAARHGATDEPQAAKRTTFGEWLGLPPPGPPYEPPTDGVARIRVSGTILQSVPDWFALFDIDATGTDDLCAALKTALEDPAVNAILFVIDSPGGTLGGLQELGDAIHEARDTKPIEAACVNLCASAAYWIAASASRVTATKTTQVGSIGVYSVMRDFSRLYESIGIRTHVIASSPLKGAGAVGAPITERQLEVQQEQIDALDALFREQVARGRSMDTAAVAAVAKGRVWIASAAQGLGLIDAVLSVDDTHRALAESAKPKPPQSRYPSPQGRSSTVSLKTAAAPAIATVDFEARAAQLEKELAETRATAAAQVAEAQAAAKEQQAALAARAAEIEDQRLTAEYSAKATKFPHLLGLAAGDVAAILRCAETGLAMSKELGAKLVESFVQTNAAIAQSALLKEQGSGARTTGASPIEQVNAFAADLQAKNPKLTKEQAFVMATQQHADLYTAHLNAKPKDAG